MGRTTKRARKPEPKLPRLKQVEVLTVPLLLTRKEAARLFGRSVRWFDNHVQTEGIDILRGSRVLNGRRVYRTRAILDHIDGLPS